MAEKLEGKVWRYGDSSRHEVTASAQGEDATMHLGERRR